MAMEAVEAGSDPDTVGQLMADAIGPRSKYTGEVETAIHDRLATLQGELNEFRKANGLPTGETTTTTVEIERAGGDRPWLCDSRFCRQPAG